MTGELQHFNLDQTQFVVPPSATQEFFGSIVDRFFNDVTGEFDAVSAKAYFDAWLGGACETIIAHVLSEGGDAIDCVDAFETFRRAVVDHIVNRFVGNTEAGTSGQSLIRSDQFQTFVKNNAGTLKAAGFTEKEIGTIEAIAADLRRANRSISGLRIPGSSNTAQDMLAAAKSEVAASILSRIVTAATTGGNIVAAIGKPLASALREQGFESVDDIVADALLNPERAKLLLHKMPASTENRLLDHFASLYRKAAPATAGVTLSEGTATKGGRVGGNRNQEWVEERIRTLGGMPEEAVEGAMQAVRRATPEATTALMKEFIALEKANLPPADRAAAVQDILTRTLGQDPNTPAARWMGRRHGNIDKVPLEITVPVPMR